MTDVPPTSLHARSWGALLASALLGVACSRGAGAVSCPLDSVLLDGRCQVACQRTGDCLSGELCIAGVCRGSGGQPDAQPNDTGEVPPDLGVEDLGLEDVDAGIEPKPDLGVEDLGTIEVGPIPDGGVSKPNFRVSIRSLNPVLRVAEPLSVDVILVNDGTAPGPVDVSLLLAPSDASDLSRAVSLTPIGTTSTRLASGQQTVATFQARISPDTVPTDELRFFVALDVANQIDEVSETDNLASQLVVVDALDWTPTSVAYPLSPRGCRVSRSVRVSNLGSNRVELSNVRVTGVAFEFDGQSSAAIDRGASGSFDVAFRPRAAGATAGSLDFDYKGQGAAGSLVGTVALSGEGVERHVETFTQGSARKVDVAIFVDEGPAPAAAAARQRAVDQVPALVQRLVGFDHRIAVHGAQSGVLRGAPVTAQTAMPEQVLVAQLMGSSMVGDRPRYFESAATALAGTLRPDAWLALVFVGRDDDAADTIASSIARVRVDPGLPGIPEPTVVSAIAPARAGILVDLTACSGLGGTSRVAQLTAAFGGLVDDLCADPSTGLSDLGAEAGLDAIVGLPFRFGPTAERFDMSGMVGVATGGRSLMASQFSVDFVGQSVFLTRDAVPPASDSVDIGFVPVCGP
jgi:hypothetical protein